ncbi:metallophosphoesterase [Rapidithrix thailandica]|uniref:Metallophosphoesterase n=1 Tax=Rapidithrix thailandica TaxID=413964 RepID=A0AAW9S4E4_9BACT
MKGRRKFLQQLTIGSAGLMLPFTSVALGKTHKWKSLKFGVIADPHKDIIPDADQRLEAFIEKAEEEKPDFIINLGDFCFAKEQNKPFLKRFEQVKVPTYHVLGNHDMDYNTKEQMMEFLEMPGKYYSFDSQGYHFVVLDANYLYQDGTFTDYQKGNFYVDFNVRTFIDDRQIEWFQADLEATSKPTIVFSHQGLMHHQMGVKNRLRLQLIMEQVNQKAGYNKVIACLNGHNHIDFHRVLNGIHYFEINSMSYHWFGHKKFLNHYDSQLLEQYPHLPNMGMYKEALYAFVSIEPKGGILKVQGVRSQWAPVTPERVGIRKGIFGSEGTPQISDYEVKL